MVWNNDEMTCFVCPKCGQKTEKASEMLIHNHEEHGKEL